jgi:hypothetical protein
MKPVLVRTSSVYFAEKHKDILKEELAINELVSKLKYIQQSKVQQLANVIGQLRDKRHRLRKVRLR